MKYYLPFTVPRMYSCIHVTRSQLMLNAHIDSMILLATPLKLTTTQPFAFGSGTPWADITAQIRDNIPLILKHRLTPPLRETTV
jgi:aarF domain-containing kinase